MPQPPPPRPRLQLPLSMQVTGTLKPKPSSCADMSARLFRPQQVRLGSCCQCPAPPAASRACTSITCGATPPPPTLHLRPRPLLADT